MEQNLGGAMYEKLAKTKPERKIPKDGKDGKEPKSLSDKEENYDDKSDLQAQLDKLFPGDLGNDITNKLMVARVAPDSLMDLLYLATEADVFNTPFDKTIDVAKSVIKHYILTTIGLDSKGRIDQIALAGASKEDDDLDKMGKNSFGIGS